MTNKQIKLKVDELVRDLTKVFPRPKSEVKRKINELLTKQKTEIEFYLDPMEFINKPRRVFMGLIMKLEICEGTKKEKMLCKRIIKEAEKDFYIYTLPKFKLK